jgi:hypothetical protein
MSRRKREKTIFFISISILVVAVAYLYFAVYQAMPHLKLAAPLHYSRHSEGQELGNDVTIEADSETFEALQAWLSKKRTWQMDINTYAPGQVITGKGFDLNFTGNKVILNACERERKKSRQYSCKADEELTAIFKKIQKIQIN